MSIVESVIQIFDAKYKVKIREKVKQNCFSQGNFVERTVISLIGKYHVRF